MASYPQDRLARSAAESTSLVDLMRRIGAPMGSRPLRYLRGRLELYGIDTSHFAEEPLPGQERRSYSEATLSEAAAHSFSIRGMAQHMGFPPDDFPYGHIRKKLDRFGIDTSHFTSGRGTPQIFPCEPLTSLTANSVSLAGVLKALGVTDNGAGRARLRRSLEAHGISTAHFTGQAHRRGTPSPQRKHAAEILQPSPFRTKTALLRRALDDVGTPHICGKCGIGDTWRGKRLVLEIDHINGDRLDNRPENLRYLCPSCHSQTGTFSKRHRQCQ
ncbi:HNH endonuclease signature motif containing protein [Streptomyces sp. NPDC056696]|uniref:HNH endonuclease signature motif containing protein n=2 Tax=Streptomyces TaxID=1883 RepID=UPI00367F3A3D